MVQYITLEHSLLTQLSFIIQPRDSAVVCYDAKIMLSKQSVAEIQTLLEGEERWKTGALDNALSQILVDFRPHDYEAWKWRFEDTFGIELDTLIKVSPFIFVYFFEVFSVTCLKNKKILSISKCYILIFTFHLITVVFKV